MSSNVKEPVVKDISRERYDLSHYSMMCGKIGQLQTFSVVPVLPGDSMQLNLQGVMRLAALRRNLYIDARVDLAAFFISHYNVYGDDWINFIKAGVDESVTFTGDTLAVNFHCIGPWATGVVPKWWSQGLPMIWNWFWRDPSDVAGILANDVFTTYGVSNLETLWGLPTCHLERMWNSTILSTLTTADYRLALDGGEVDLLNLSSLQARLKTELSRDWFMLRYNDILRGIFGGFSNKEVDKRPELLAHTSSWMSGYDVDATDTASLGTYSGKAQGVCNLSFPWKIFGEHGTLWIVGTIRFFPVHYAEKHLLMTKANPTYKEISGDPELIAREAPYSLNANEIFQGAGSVDLGKVPYAQWYREHPSVAHYLYSYSAGHPFIDGVPTTRNTAVYIPSTMYDGAFISPDQMGHWNAQCFVGLASKRYVPNIYKSIYAGTNSH